MFRQLLMLMLTLMLMSVLMYMLMSMLMLMFHISCSCACFIPHVVRDDERHQQPFLSTPFLATRHS